MTPHFNTALEGPVSELEQRLFDSKPVIERWFRQEWQDHTPPLYCEVTVRNAGFKLAPVGTNLFPDGWHNLSENALPLAAQAARATIERLCPKTRNVLIVPKSGQLSSFDMASLENLCRIFQMAKFDVRLGSIDPGLESSRELPLSGGQTLTLAPAQRERSRLRLRHFDPCTVLLNDGLERGAPGILEELHEQHLMPPLPMGTTVRRKSPGLHFYEQVSKYFAKLVGVDPWLIHPMFVHCDAPDARDKGGFGALREHIHALLGRLRHKHKEYGIAAKPFVIVKADRGPCGTGVLTVHDSGDLQRHDAVSALDLARDQLGGQVVVQEGVLTSERIGQAVAEPVIYAIGRHVVGGFYRVGAGSGRDENLHRPGASFVPLSYSGRSAGARLPNDEHDADLPDRFYAYSVMARLAMLATGHEIEALDTAFA